MGPTVSRVRCALGALTMLLATTLAPTARAEVRAQLDCYITHGDLACQDIRRAFADSIPGMDVDDAEAPLTIRLRDVEDAVGRRYFATFAGSPSGSDAPIELALSTEVPHSAGHDRALALVVALLQRGTVPFLEVSAPGTAEDGRLHLAASAGADADAEPEEPGRWYARPSVSGQYVNAGLEVIEASAGFELNYSDPEWRWRVDSEGRYRHLDVPLGDDVLRGDFLSYSARSTFARTIDSGISVAAFGGVRSQPNNNLALRGDAGLGVEWVLSPFLQANETNLGARVTLSGNYDEYVTPNIEGRSRRVYGQPSATVFGRVHTQPVDLELSAFSGFVLDQPEYWNVGGELSAAFRIADGLQLTIGGGLLYRGGAIHAPRDASQLDPVATAANGSDFGEITVQTQASLSWALGNSLLRSQDQRWQ